MFELLNQNKILILINKQMSTQAYNFNGMSMPSIRGGESSGSNTAVIVLTIAVIVLIVVVLVGAMCSMCSSGTTDAVVSTTGLARLSNAFKNKQTPAKKAAARPSSAAARPASAAARQRANRVALKNSRSSRSPTPRSRPRRYDAAYAQSAPLPASQLMTQPSLPVADSAMSYTVSASGSIGDSEMDRPTTETGGTSMDEFVGTSYAMDPGMMTPASTSDIQGMETFMPLMNDGVGKAHGPVDPSTGLPLFTTGKLVRSQMLGGHGAGSFLRKEQDPLSGYKRLGKNMCGAQNARRDLAVRRAQFNKARLADPNGDPVLFQTSEFAYS